MLKQDHERQRFSIELEIVCKSLQEKKELDFHSCDKTYPQDTKFVIVKLTTSK